MAKEKKVKNENKSFMKDFKAELKKVVWPTSKQMVNNVTAVIVIVLITAAIVFCLDFVFGAMNDYGVNKLKSHVQSNNEVQTENIETTTTDEQTTTDAENTDTTNDNAESNIEEIINNEEANNTEETTNNEEVNNEENAQDNNSVENTAE